MSVHAEQKSLDKDDYLTNDTAKEIVEAIERPKQATKSDSSTFSRGSDVPSNPSDAPAGGHLPALDLPGFGEEGDTCGDDIPHFCSCCGEDFDIGRTCQKSMCPRCGASWVLKRAGTSRDKDSETGQMRDVPGYVARLDATARMMSAERDEPVYLHHVGIMPPHHDWFLESGDPLDRTVKVIKEIEDIMDAQGVTMYHPWSGDNDKHEDDQGEWKKRQFSGRDWETDVRNELKRRGHFHLVVASPHIPGGEVTNQVYEATGWIIRRFAKRDGSGRSLDGLKDVARAVTYALSHTGVDTSGRQNRAAIFKHGSIFTWNQLDCPAMDEADTAVREVAPETLGIPPNSLRCKKEVAPDDAADDELDLTTPDADGDGDGDELGEEQPEEIDLVPCKGKIHRIDRAPDYLNDPEWCENAAHAAELRRAWEHWEAGDGWPGG